MKSKSDQIFVAELIANFDGAKESLSGGVGVAFAEGADTDGKLQIAVFDAFGLVFKKTGGASEPAARLREVAHMQRDKAAPEGAAGGATRVPGGDETLVSESEEFEALIVMTAEMGGEGEVGGVHRAERGALIGRGQMLISRSPIMGKEGLAAMIERVELRLGAFHSKDS